MFILETERLILRDFSPQDFEAFYATTQEPEYQQYYAESEMERSFWEQIFTRILASTAAPERDAYQLAVCLQSGGLIGTCGVRMEDRQHRQASFGCALARPYWGYGYALEAARRLVDFGFHSLPIHRLYAETNGENRAARRLAERLGLRLEGLLKGTKFFRGRWWDTAVYAILEEEWQEKKDKAFGS